MTKKKPAPAIIKDLAKFGYKIGLLAMVLEVRPVTAKMILDVEANKKFAEVLKGIVIDLGKLMDKHYKL